MEIRKKRKNSEFGMALMETVVALGILAVVAVTFLGGLSAVQRATIFADERATAGSLAQSQMEHVKKAPYVFSAVTYDPAPLPLDQDYDGYSASVTVAPVHATDDGIQRVTITVSKDGREILSLHGYKGNR